MKEIFLDENDEKIKKGDEENQPKDKNVSPPSGEPKSTSGGSPSSIDFSKQIPSTKGEM